MIVSLGLSAYAFDSSVAQEPSSASEPAALVRRATQNQLSAGQSHIPQRFHLRKVDERHDVTREIVETKDGDVARLIEVNGKPLGPLAAQAEQNRLNELKNHPEVQEHRRRREAEDEERANQLIRLLPDAFTYQSAGAVPCPAGQCTRLTFMPNPKFDPPNMEANILRGMAGEMWIDPVQERITRIDAHLIDDVDFGWGMIGRLHKGGTVLLEQADVGSHQWAVTRLKLNLTGRALLIKTLTVQMTEEESDFSPLPSPIDFRQAIQLLVTPASTQAELADTRR
jgi:hypothetical protein